MTSTAVLREAWATLPESSSQPLPATLAQSRNLAHASLETAVQISLGFSKAPEPDVRSLDAQSSIFREFSAVPELHASGSCHLQPVFVCTFTVLVDVNQLIMIGVAPCTKMIWNSSEFSYYATSAIQRTDVCSPPGARY